MDGGAVRDRAGHAIQRINYSSPGDPGHRTQNGRVWEYVSTHKVRQTINDIPTQREGIGLNK